MSAKYTTTSERVSYGIGRQMAEQLKNDPFDGMDIEILKQGISDVFAGVACPVSDELMATAFREMAETMQSKQKSAGQSNADIGQKFLAENAGKPGVTVTDSGLQYTVLQEGKGGKPGISSRVRTHYHGTLIDGTVFDSSYMRGEPAEFPVSGVIAGWTEALQLMDVGSKWRLFIPHHLAYGEQGAGGKIGPCETLVFDVELLAITGR